MTDATETSPCCGAKVSFGDGGLYCKACYETLDWEDVNW